MSRLTFIFGPEVHGLPLDEAARRSTERFVRSEGGLALYEESRNPTGQVLTAWEAYNTFGLDVLEEAVEWSSAILRESANATGDALRMRRESLDLPRTLVARAARVDESDIDVAETTPSRLSIHKLERIAFALGLDERLLAFKNGAGGDADLAVRLRTLQTPIRDAPGVHPAISARTALLFSEAASIIRVQRRLQDWLDIPTPTDAFTPNSDYGSDWIPAWKIGYRLAEEARDVLGIGDTPIPSMRVLVEEHLGIPVVQARLPNSIAGATVMTTDENGDAVRGVVLNTVGHNQNVWIRRVTLAHELGHLLYDPDDHLERVQVDSYRDSQTNPEDEAIHYIEQRANAFAIAFLAPNDAVRLDAPPPVSKESVARVMDTFGISHTSARYHISNCHYHNYDVPSGQIGLRPSYEWIADEDFALDYFPLGETPDQRRGRFAGLVAASYQEGFISVDTAALYLRCEKDEVQANAASVRSLYNGV